MTKPPLLIHSNAPWTPTGYGQQTALFTPGLSEHYDLGISAFYGLEGNIIHWHGCPVYPGIGQTHGNETILQHAQVHMGDLRAGLAMTLMDVWVLEPAVWRQLNTCCWTPIDHEPAPDPIVSFFAESGAIPIAMSKFGEEQLRNAGLDPLYVPHAIDTSIYKPLDKAESREITHLPADTFIVGQVAANKGNPSRKCFAEAMQAFRLFHAKHPEARLYLHTEISGMFDGVNLPDLIRNTGVDPDTVIFPDQYRVIHFPYPPEIMAKIYSSLDVLLAPSAGEGFGIPVIEAQACGVPVIVSDFSAQPELCGAGWLVSGTKVYTPLKAWQFHPDVDDIHDALRQAYVSGDHSAKARAHAEQYDLKVVLNRYMLPALTEVQARFDDRKPI